MFVKLFGTGARRRFSTAARAPARLQQYRHHLTLAGAALITSGLAMFSTSAYSQNDQSILAEMNQRLIRLEDAIVTYSGFLQKVNEVKAAYPGNLAMKHFDASYFHGLLPELKQRLYRVVKSGVENPDSSMGCYAMYPDDYEVLRPFFGPVIKEYHKIQGEVHHKTNWDLGSVQDPILPADHVLDLTKLGLGTTSMRVRVGRNLDAFPLPGAQTRAQRVQMEEQLVGAFQKLMADPKYGGNYYSLTPGSKYAISPEKYQQLVDSHVMFKDMSADTYLTSAGIASDWPYGRGCYQSADGGFIVWVGEEDHLRIMCMKKGTVLNDVFDRLKAACDVVEKAAGKFAHSPDYGYVTSCPTNLGTGCRASVLVKLPNLTADGTDAKAKAICKPLGLSVRGMGGEHTPIGADGTVDISPSARLQITEAQIIVALYKGMSQLLEAEKKAAGSKL